MEFFQCEKITPNITLISDLVGVHAFLIEGSQKAALLDTCNGIGNLKSLVESLTALPLDVICTHGHVDHAGGTYGFERVYLNEKDFELVKYHTDLEFRIRDSAVFLGQGTIPREDFLPQRSNGYENLVDGQVFDLGGITLEAVAFPGHTQGMVAILVRELRILLLGDGCNSRTFMFLPDSTSIEAYKQSLQRLLDRYGDLFDTVWFSHGPYRGSKQIVKESIELCGEIMAGTTDNLPFEFMGMTGCLAKAALPDGSRADGNQSNIVFNPDRIFT